ncbi:hypothetical protein O0I10_000679 [Lichtheimia ornata]|uniref:UDENN FLCN/SMCR8-type domain-containing protein n=1 Tax=Lichtheimia ornata TaxID=688661 RepID=A0AAD7Y461_9FUNG|nr:uncharacterized protein O0I10_000679 [Lichtheimia ornata]KAJ8663440.1 hypothetical protein O0I10_000679 [Lichtheimia ornata]
MNALIALLHFCEVHGPSVVFCTQPTHNNEHRQQQPNTSFASDASAIATVMSKLTMATNPNTNNNNNTSTISIPTTFNMDKQHLGMPSSLSSTPSTAEPPTPPSTIPRVSSPVPPWKKPGSSNSNICVQQQQQLPTSSSSSSSSIIIPYSSSTTTAPPISCRSSSSSSSSSCSTTSSVTATCCAACSAQLPLVQPTTEGVPSEAKRLVTRDSEDPSVEYVGAKGGPQQLHLYKAVRLACVRSLTTEFCPGREGPVLFGDEENGYVMSYLFKIRDAQARGEARFYAIMILMTDRVFLISCWPFLVSSFRSMAINLQEKADTIFQREKEVRERVHPFANRRVTAPITQEQFLRRRSNSASLRSLVDLLGIKDIYLQIHVQFCYILKLSARRRMEKVTPGRSPSEAYLKMQEEYRRKRHQQQQKHSSNDSQSDDKTSTSATTTTASSILSSATTAKINNLIPSSSGS